MAWSVGRESMECRRDGNLLCDDQMAFPVFHVPQKDLPSRIICCLNIHISARKKIFYKIPVGLYLAFAFYSSTNIFYEKNDQKNISILLDDMFYCFRFLLQSK